ncbi:MAG: RlpA-like double-psi beta-barrel domain-containing protein [bacterium]
MKKKTLIIGVVLLTLGVGNFVSAETGWGIFAKLYQQSLIAKPAINNLINTVSTAVAVVEVSPITAELGFSAIQNGQTVKSADQQLSVNYLPQSLLRSTSVEIKSVNITNLPWNLEKISPIYQIDLADDATFVSNIGAKLNIYYQGLNNDHKQIFFYDARQDVWQPLSSLDWPSEHRAEVLLTRPFIQVAVFAHSGVMTSGQASWYAYKNCNCAASPDFAKGSVIRVTNKANGRSVDVTINDWGPERNKHPERAIDLDKIAFAKIASLRDGVIDVQLQPLSIAPDSQGRVLGIKEQGLTAKPLLTAKSAIIMDESGRILYDQASETVMPLASLTKTIAIWTFLDIKPNLFAAVAYQYVDEQLNYQYCKPSESAKVTLKDGDLVLVKDLIYSALVGSANNVVETLVRVSGLDRADFIARMNDNVVKWGATKTKFVEPTGLSTKNVSTAKDYAIILRRVFSNEIIAQASVTPKYEFTTINTQIKHSFRNTNSLVASQAEIVGSKTGYLYEAGYCLAVKVKQPSGYVYIVTLGAPKRQSSFDEMNDLINYAHRL